MGLRPVYCSIRELRACGAQSVILQQYHVLVSSIPYMHALLPLPQTTEIAAGLP